MAAAVSGEDFTNLQLLLKVFSALFTVIIKLFFIYFIFNFPEEFMFYISVLSVSVNLYVNDV